MVEPLIAKDVPELSRQAGEDAALRSLPALITRELPADLETPVTVYLKLSGQGPSFLLESVTGGEQLARYSFIGVHASRAYLIRSGALECDVAGTRRLVPILPGSDPLDGLRDELARFRPQSDDLPAALPRFTGGLVGYLSYEMIRFFEPTVDVPPHAALPDGIFLLTDTTVAFDHAFGKLVLMANVSPEGGEAAARAEAEARLDEIERRLAGPLPSAQPSLAPAASTELQANMTREQYMQAVEAAKEHIAAGDIFQVVLSQRLCRETSAEPFAIYRALRRLNPSPYMFFFDFDELVGGEPLHIVGASPELHVRLEGTTATVRPIAGTRPRGKSPQEDLSLERDLLADPKERAEHVMLVDLARNDLGRVCNFGTVRVQEQMIVERYSHVMHIVSQVEGQLRPDLDAFDLVRATFPAGTVSGAPKIRAMQIIHDLESDPRGPYAGAVGYFGADGSLDTCITLRTLVMRGRTICVQAGAGIVADSQPASEYQETLNKARALAQAVEMAEKSALSPQAAAGQETTI
jgi:anthranilate synthase component 1